MKRLRDGMEQPRHLIDSAKSDTGGLLKTGILSLLLHMILIIFLALNLKPAVTKTQSIYHVTLRPFSPPGRIQSATPGGNSGGTSPSQPTEQLKLGDKEGRVGEQPKLDRKGEKPEKGEALQSAKKQKVYERWRKAEIEASIRSPSQKGEKPKKERESNTSLQEALADIHKKVALDNIQKRVEKRTPEGRSAARQTGEGQPPLDSSQSQTGPSSKGGSGSGVGTGIGSGAGGYPIGGVPWGSPQGSSAWNSKLDDYYNMIWAKIKEEWTLPENLPKGKIDLETTIVVIIDREGKVRKSWFEKKSGNGLYDQMAMRAIKKAEPFPPIPKEFSDNTFEIGIRFHPD
jgi:colicin import membrane protein